MTVMTSVPERRSERREQILDAAEACFTRLGLRETRVEDILKEAGLSRATFYRHFDNIDAVLIRLVVRAARGMMEAAVRSSVDVSARPGSDRVRRIARVIAEIAGRSSDAPILGMLAKSDELNRLSNLIMLADADMDELTAPLVPLLAEAIAIGELRSDLDIKRMVEWLTRNATSIRTRLPPWAHSPDELEGYVLDFVMPALLPTTRGDMADVLNRLAAIERRLGGPCSGDAADL